MVVVGLLLTLLGGVLPHGSAPAPPNLIGFDICAVATTILAQAEPDDLRTLADSVESLPAEAAAGPARQRRAGPVSPSRAEATESYWRAVRSLADSAVAAEFGRDLHYILDPQEATEWAELQPEARADWTRRFWSRRSARDLVTVEERLAEHYRRLHYARTNYRRFTWGKRTVTSDLFRLLEEEILDDRGLVYIILGKPGEDILCTIPGRSCRSWIYEMGEPRPIPLTFRTGGASDWYLISDLPPDVYARLGSVDPYFYAYAWRLWLQSRDAQGDPQTAWAAPLRAAEASLRERRRAEREADVTLARDRHRLPLDYLLEFGFEWLFFQSSQPGQIAATLAYALPSGRLDCRAPDGTRTCRVEVRASILGRDTVLAWEAMSGQVRLREGPGSWLFGHLRLEAVPGTWEYRLALFESPDATEEGRVRGNWAGGAFTLPRLWPSSEPGRVSVSSLVLARPGAGTGSAAAWRWRSTRCTSIRPVRPSSCTTRSTGSARAKRIPRRSCSYPASILRP